MNVAILGRTRMLYNTIDMLAEKGHKIVLIGTCRAEKEYDIKEDDFQKKAEEMNAVYFNDVKINSDEIIALLKKAGADIAISVNWITIIYQKVIECFKYGILNAHCGDLPRYRGNACPNWAIINNEQEYAITIHKMQPGELDSGEIIVKEHYPINNDTTIGQIYDNMYTNIPILFCKAVDLIAQNDRCGQKQSKKSEDILRCYPRIPTDSYIDWNNSIADISRLIRASGSPFLGAFTYMGDKKIYILEAWVKPYDHPVCVIPGQIIRLDKAQHSVEVAAADGSVVISKIMCDGMLVNNVDEFFKSTRIRLNYCIPEEVYLLKNEIEALKKMIRENNHDTDN